MASIVIRSRACHPAILLTLIVWTGGLNIPIPCVAQDVQRLLASTLPSKKDYSGGSFGFEALLRVEPSTVGIGETLTITWEARCKSGSRHVYNGFCSNRYRLPVQIVVASIDGKFRQELLSPTTAPPEKSDANCWLQLRSTQSIGRELHVEIAKSADKGVREQAAGAFLDISPGEYFAQVIYNPLFVAAWRNSPGTAKSVRAANEMGDEPQFDGQSLSARMNESIAISEPVKFTVGMKLRSGQQQKANYDCAVRLELTPPVTRVISGRQVEVEIRIVNQSEEIIDVFNPQLDPWIVSRNRAIDLSILNADGTYIGNHMDKESGHTAIATKKHWVRFAPGGMVASRFQFWSGSVPGTRFMAADDLPPGKYFLQLRGGEAMLAAPPLFITETDDTKQIMRHPSFDAWSALFPGPEICRSNRVELEILPRTGD